MSEDLFDQAAKNQGFESLAELAEVSKTMTNEVDPTAVADNMDDPACAPIRRKE